MNILLYIILLVIGILVGIYWGKIAIDIPKKLDLKKVHYTNKANEEFLSKLTYTIIGGMTSVIFANILKININNLDISSITIYIFTMLYVSTLVLAGGIDKKYSKIDKKILAFGIISSIVYMIYMFNIDLTSVYLDVIYLAIYIVLLVVDAFLLRKFAKDSYIVNLLILLSIILVYTNYQILIYTIVMAVIAILLYVLILRSQKRKNGNRKLKINEIPIGFFVSASNIIVLFMTRILLNK